MPEPKKAPAKKAAPPPAAPRVELPDHKDDLAALAIAHGVPSYEAWAMTVDDLRADLTKKLGG